MMGPLSCSAVLLPLLALCLNLPPSLPIPLSPDDSFTPVCGGLLPDPPFTPDSFTPAQGWLRWSSSATWSRLSQAVPGTAHASTGGVPRVGVTSGANVTIPCGVGVLLDVPSVQVTFLNILGALKLRDDASLPSIALNASFIIVEGRLIIGTPTQHFSQKATVTLLPNTNNRLPFRYTARAPADAANPRDLGHKALVVVGGQVDLHGMPGGGSTPSWTKLRESAAAAGTEITVLDDVWAWPVGSPVLITSTDYRSEQDDVAVISRVTSAGDGSGRWRVKLDRPLRFNHFGDPRGVPDGFGGFIDETAEVALLSRNIVVRGLEEPPPFNLEGGHMMVFMTSTQQMLEGVELTLMGQQGSLGRYPIHFHACGDQSGRSVIRKNLVARSKQRCVVIHATFNALVESNVAFDTVGHCYSIEDGSETGNTFLNNLGARTRAPQILIPGVTDPKLTDETDNLPATFWITNPNNSYIGNVAAGSEDSGFWMQFLRFTVRGISKTWPKHKKFVPNLLSVTGTYANNTGHSNFMAGLRLYPESYFPDEVYTAFRNTRMQVRTKPKFVAFGGWTFYKNMQMGAHIHSVSNVALVDSSFADNTFGVFILQSQGINVSRRRFVGLSNNYGNPTDCSNTMKGWRTCQPVTGCAFPPAPGVAGRSVADSSQNIGGANQSSFGAATATTGR